MGEVDVFGVYLMEDHASFRQSMAMLLDSEPDFQVSGQAGTLAEARSFLARIGKPGGTVEAPAVGLFDLNLPDGDGTQVIAEFQAANPEFAALVLTASIEDAEHARAIEAGASGVLHKVSDIDEIIDALRMLANGASLLSQDEIVRMVRIAAESREQDLRSEESAQILTKREKQVIAALATGKSNKDIASDLRISVDTERTHMVNILHKLGAHSRLQALVVAVQLGIVEIERF